MRGSTWRPRGLFQSRGLPDQSVSSFNWTISSLTPPNTIAPNRPLPIGSACTHSAAGFLYHKRSLEDVSFCGVGRDVDQRLLPSAAPPATAGRRLRNNLLVSFWKLLTVQHLSSCRVFPRFRAGSSW